MTEGGIYVHIPFCNQKCLYCDFYTGGSRIANWEEYTEALLRELELRIDELNFNPTTLYLGGGTPSLLPIDKLKKLKTGIEFLLKDNNNWIENTIEVNPEDITEENVIGWKEAGFNRISIGVQTLKDNELRAIGRRHNAMQAQKGLDLIAKYFQNITADIMFGIPGQTALSLQESIETLLMHKLSHISVYALMLEPGTAMTLLHDKGRIKLPEEEEWLKMFEVTIKILKEGGFKRYEISNYSLPGFESRHNSNYWRGKPYLGLGPGAHSFDGERVRKWNPNDIKGFLNHYTTGVSKPFYEMEILTDEEIKEEFIMTRLRMEDGINLNEFIKKFGAEEEYKLLEKAKFPVNKGFMSIENGNLKFTFEGFKISDTILTGLI